MNFRISIAKEAIGFDGYREIEIIETLGRWEALKKLEGKEIKRRFNDPFNSSIEIVVIA